MSPSGGKFTKFSIAPSSIICTPSVESRFLTATVSPLVGLTEDRPHRENSALSSATMMASPTKIQKGWGSLLPALSTASRSFITPRDRRICLPFYGGAGIDTIRLLKYGGCRCSQRTASHTWVCEPAEAAEP